MKHLGKLNKEGQGLSMTQISGCSAATSKQISAGVTGSVGPCVMDGWLAEAE